MSPAHSAESPDVAAAPKPAPRTVLDASDISRALTRIAHEALLKEDRKCALEGYRALLGEFPDDPVAQIMIERLMVA